jgi:HNH endonuclease
LSVTATLSYVPRADTLAELGVRMRLEQAIVDRDGHGCFYCGTTGRMTIDHVVPRHRGGSDAIGNLVFACPSCNFSKLTSPGWLYVLWLGTGGTGRVDIRQWKFPSSAASTGETDYLRSLYSRTSTGLAANTVGGPRDEAGLACLPGGRRCCL